MANPFWRVALVPLLAVTLLAAALPAAPVARAQVRGEIVGPGKTRLPVAVAELKWMGGLVRTAAADAFRQQLAADLELSGLFHIIDPGAHIEDPQQAGITGEGIDFDDWAAIGALGLVRGGYWGTPQGLTVEVRFFDVSTRASKGGRRLSGEGTTAARMAHRMTDAIMGFVTGVPGPFDSRIVFVSNREDHYREVYMYSFDGSVDRLTRHRSVTMAPAWHPSVASILFTSFKERHPALFRLDLASAAEDRITRRLGVNVGGAWAPDQSRVVLAREADGNTDLYSLDPDSGESKRLTRHWAIDVDPAWSPDGRHLAFCSSRSGKPQVYVMRADGSQLRRLSFEGEYNSAPAWSPDGTLIAYAGRRQGRFQIFTVEAAGGTPRQLTFGGSNEDPSWSPDSRYLAFTHRRSGVSSVYMTDVHGRWLKQLTDEKGDDSSPNWSPRRPRGPRVDGGDG